MVILHLTFDVSETFAFLVEILRLIDDSETRPLHLKEIFAAELSIVPDLADLESILFPGLVPVYDGRRVVGRRVAHIQPAIVPPAEQGNIVLVRLFGCRYDWEPCMCDDDIDPVIVSHQRRRRQVVQFGQVCAAIPVRAQRRKSPHFSFRRPLLLDSQRLLRPPVASAELLHVKVRLERRREAV